MSDKDQGDKWAKIEATARPRGKVTGGSESAEGKGKGEAQRLKGITAKRAREANNYLKTISPDQVGMLLTSSRSQLTAKQKAFAYHVAEGATKAAAYRQAYPNAKSKNTIHHEPYRIAADPRIAAEIEAYKLAAQAAKHRTAEDLRALVIQTLVQQVIDPDCPPAVRTQAAKTLGNVTEVAAFTERKESVVHHSSDKLRAQILEQVTALMGGKTIEGERIEQDAASLLAELAAPDQGNSADGPSLDAQDGTEDERSTDGTRDTPSDK